MLQYSTDKPRKYINDSFFSSLEQEQTFSILRFQTWEKIFLLIIFHSYI